MVFTLFSLNHRFATQCKLPVWLLFSLVKASAEGCAEMAVLQTIATTGESLGHRTKVAIRRRWHFMRLAIFVAPFRQDLRVYC